MAADSPTLTRPGLWPKEIPRHTESGAEQKVYKALTSSLPKGWYAWHSLRLRTREKGEFSEADFIIADPNRPGILILEIKGGQIEQRDGRWYQTSVQLKSSPLDQAFSFRRNLIGRFKEKDLKVPTIGVAVCFPDTSFEQQPARDDLKGLVIGGQDLPYLNKILPDIMAHAIPDPWPVKGPWIRLPHTLWGETWIPDICLGGRVEMDEENRLQLDHEQMSILENLEEINRLLSGGLKPNDIAVVSLRGRGSKEGITHKKDIGSHPVVLATDPKAGENIICDTFLRFKGLERPAVIVTDLRLVSDLYEKRMHIAVSRALSLLRIVGMEKEIKKDPVLAKIL